MADNDLIFLADQLRHQRPLDRWEWVRELTGLLVDKPVLVTARQLSRLATDGYAALVKERMQG